MQTMEFVAQKDAGGKIGMNHPQTLESSENIEKKTLKKFKEAEAYQHYYSRFTGNQIQTQELL